jgi:CheY-like chemotaxis protein
MSETLDMVDAAKKARILIVEDEPMVAYVLAEFLTDAGFEVGGVAGRLEAALALIERGGFDAAVLDANLAGVSAGPVATALRARGLPFIVVSGYLPRQQDAAFAGAPCLQKPCKPELLLKTLQDTVTVQ